MMTSNELPLPLIEAVSNGSASLFLGAGASMEAGFPNTSDVTKHLVSHLGADAPSDLLSQPLDFVAEYIYQKPGYGKQWVREKLVGLFDNLHKSMKRPPSAAHHWITSTKWRSIFTTNYDRVVEIAYDTNLDCVQQLLPIYSPDPQILRHESNTVRYIKLNGSIDELARNSSHELVITFAEQQDARSRNASFYELLKTESVNGPIIFVGFRFAHPGSQLAGTSPEFEQLRYLLREMGPATRWHYCVSPIDESSANQMAVTTLRASQFAVIDATFGEFAQCMVERINRDPVPLRARPQVIVPAASTTISIDAAEFDRDKRQFELLGTYVEGLAAPQVNDALNGDANWGSFVRGHLITRECRPQLIKQIDMAIQTQPNIVLFSAPAGWGKTFLLRDIAIEYYRTGHPVFWLNSNSSFDFETSGSKSVVVSAWDDVRIENVLAQISDEVKKQKGSIEQWCPILIADNCPERASEVAVLNRRLRNYGRPYVILFSTRDTDIKRIFDDYPLFSRATRFTPESVSTHEEIRSLIDFCTFHHVAQIDSPAQKEIIANRIFSEEANTALILALQVIYDKKHRPFSEIVAELWDSLGGIEYAHDLVLRVAVLHQFGSEFTPRLYSLLQTFLAHERSKVTKAYQECMRIGVLFERLDEDEPCIFTLHSLVAEKIVKVANPSVEDIDNSLTLLVGHMTNSVRDLEIVRDLLKLVSESEINLSSEESTNKLFSAAAKATENDWVVCQQYAKYLMNRQRFDSALAWINNALEMNSDHAPLHHTRGNVLRRWGMHLLGEGNTKEADRIFAEAANCFATSRVRREADEYGYVTHLDMIRYRLQRENDEFAKANLLAEGVRLYREALSAIPEDKYNFILEDRYKQSFDLDGRASAELYEKIEQSIKNRMASDQAVSFLAQHYFEVGHFQQAINAIQRQRSRRDTGILLLVKEAELNAREGLFAGSALAIDSAKRRRSQAEDPELLWKLAYWELVVSIILQDYSAAREASGKLSLNRNYIRQRFPRGYIWKSSAHNISIARRTFREHGKIWSGQVHNIRSSGLFGEIRITNISGDSFYVPFNPRYFSRGDFRRGDRIDFIMTLLPDSVRADDVNSKPFINTPDNLYVECSVQDKTNRG